MPANTMTVDELAVQLACEDIMDQINDDDVDAAIQALPEDEQKLLAQRTVIQWTKNDNLNIRDLLSIEKIRGRKDNFVKFLSQAVNTLAPVHALAVQSEPEIMIAELSNHPTFIDGLNDMPELKAHLIEMKLKQNVDQIVARLPSQDNRNQLMELFRSEKCLSESINAASLVKDLLETLSGEKPWEMFSNPEYNQALFADHAAMVNLLITECDAKSIGEKLRKTPDDHKRLVSRELHALNEAFRGLTDKGIVADNIFSIISNAQSPDYVAEKTEAQHTTGRPSLDALQKAAGTISHNSFFEPAKAASAEAGAANQHRPS